MQRRRVRRTTSSGTPRRSPPPSSSGTTVEAARARRTTALPRRHRPTAPGAPGNVVVATGPHGTPARCRPAAATRLDVVTANRATATRTSCPPGGVLVVGASASGVQIADELRPRRPRGDPRGRPAHPDAPPLPRHGHLLVARGHRPARPHHRRDARRRARPGGSRRCSSSAAATRRAARPRPRPRCRRTASGWPAGCERRRRCRRASFADDLAATVAAADQRMHRFLDAVDDHVAAHRPGPRGLGPGPAATAPACRTRRAGSTCAPRGSAPSCWATGYRPHYPGCAAGRRPPTADPAAPRRHRRARPVRRRPAVPAPARLGVHRRRPARRRGRRPRTCSPRSGESVARRQRGAGGMNALRRRRRRRPGRRRLDRDAAGPGRRCASRLLDRSGYGTDTLSTHA